MWSPRAHVWRTAEELVQIGYERSRVLMLNEAHDGLARCRRTRLIGQRVIPTAHQCGVRHLALEALDPHTAHTANTHHNLPPIPVGYLAQHDMRDFIHAALHRYWQLIAYDDDGLHWLETTYGITFPDHHWTDETIACFRHYQAALQSQDYTNYREEQQARNLLAFLTTAPANTKLFVWCGNGHHGKRKVQDWVPMGYQFKQLSGIDPFCIDQTLTIKFKGTYSSTAQRLLDQFGDELQQRGGTAGFLTQEAPAALRRHTYVDAILLSRENELSDEL